MLAEQATSDSHSLVSDLSNVLNQQTSKLSIGDLVKIERLLDLIAIALRQGKRTDAKPVLTKEELRDDYGQTDLPELLSTLLSKCHAHLSETLSSVNIGEWKRLIGQVGRVAANLVADSGRCDGSFLAKVPRYQPGSDSQ